MKRKLFDRIKKLDRDENKRMIILCGMKGSGKTFGTLNYVKNNYDEYLYIDASDDSEFIENIEKVENMRIRTLISELYEIEEEYLFNIPVIIDEPSAKIIAGECFKGYDNSLKLFVITSDKRHAEYLMEACGESVGDIGLIEVNPLDFGEFLIALDKEWYEEIIAGHMMRKRRMPEMIHQELLDLHDLYVQIGGLPEVLNEYLRLGTLDNIRERQLSVRNSLWFYYMELAELTRNSFLQENGDKLLQILSKEKRGYYSDISDTKIRGILDAAEKVLEKENHKFMFSTIRDGVTRRQYEGSMDLLCSQGVVFKIPKLNSDSDVDFRLYYGDIALYREQGQDKNLESIILQNIKCAGLDAYYWESGKGASLDCVLKINGDSVPVDIRKRGKRSIKSFVNENNSKAVIMLSEDNCRFEGEQYSIPIYAAYCIERLFCTV